MSSVKKPIEQVHYAEACNKCAHVPKCVRLGFARIDQRVCDFSPSRFIPLDSHVEGIMAESLTVGQLFWLTPDPLKPARETGRCGSWKWPGQITSGLIDADFGKVVFVLATKEAAK